MPGAWMTRSLTSRSKKPVVGMYPVSNSPVSVANHAKPFGTPPCQRLACGAQVVVDSDHAAVVTDQSGRTEPDAAADVDDDPRSDALTDIAVAGVVEGDEPVGTVAVVGAFAGWIHERSLFAEAGPAWRAAPHG